MTRTELIKLIGDVLTKLDVLRGSLLPGEPNRIELDRLRKGLDSLQLKLVKNDFEDNTKKYLDATEKLRSVNGDLKKTITKLEKIVTTLETVKKLVAVVDEIISIAIPLL